MGRDLNVSGDIVDQIEDILAIAAALGVAALISLKTEDNLYSNVLVVVTIFGLLIRIGKMLLEAFFKYTETSEIKEQREAVEKALAEERAERERAEALRAEIDKERELLSKEADKLEVSKKSFLVAKHLARSERKE